MRLTSDPRAPAAPPNLPDHVPESIAARLAGPLRGVVESLVGLELELDLLFREAPRGPARGAARHLLDGGGKRVRPLLCLLAARTVPGAEATSAAAELARAGELVHAATLLHDDVIDLGETRRGRPCSRKLVGNAASVLGGDLCLVEALKVVHRAGDPALAASLVGTLDEMVAAESAQLEMRGRIDVTSEQIESIADGKTAALFGWCMEAGASCAGGGGAHVRLARSFGRELGIAFQLADDLLDLFASPGELGKRVLADVSQGTVTLPVALAIEAVPSLRGRVERAAAGGSDDDRLGSDLLAAAREAGAPERCRSMVLERTERAGMELGALPDTPARSALLAIARELAERSR